MKCSLLFLLMLMVGMAAVQPPISAHDVTVSGSTLRYLEAGPPGPTTVVLLHGARFTSETVPPCVGGFRESALTPITTSITIVLNRYA